MHADSDCSASDEILVTLAGHQYCANSRDHPDFNARVQECALNGLFNEPTAVMTQRGRNGELVLRAEHLPQEVVDLFPDIWVFLQSGAWRTEIKTLAARMKWQKALAFLSMKHPLVSTSNYLSPGLIFDHRLVQLPEDKKAFSTLVEFDESACATSQIPCLFDDENAEGTRVIYTSLGAVQLNPEIGTLSLKQQHSPEFDVITRHPLLKHKLMTAGVLRTTSSQFPMYGKGLVLMLQVVPKRRLPLQAPVSQFALWPSFWFVAYLKQVEAHTSIATCPDHKFMCLHTDVLPGGLKAMSQGTLILLSKPDNLRKALISIFLSHDGTIQVPPVLVNPVAPQPCPFAMRSKEVRKGKGKSMSHLYDSDPQKRRVRRPCVSTMHPQGRAPAAIWIAQRGLQLILLIHAADGRVALAQVLGSNGCVPSRWPPGTRYERSGKVARWDVWCRHDNDLPDFSWDLDCHWKRTTMRKKASVPICNHVLAVLPREDEILVLHRLRPRSPPQLWRVPIIQSDSTHPATFVSVCKGKGTGRNTRGPWIEDRWFDCFSPNFDSDVFHPGACEVQYGADEQPIFEFQLWQLTDTPPLATRSRNPIVPSIRKISNQRQRREMPPWCKFDGGWCTYDGTTWTQAPAPPAHGYCVKHWEAIAKVV